jgi:hypothetical protein
LPFIYRLKLYAVFIDGKKETAYLMPITLMGMFIINLMESMICGRLVAFSGDSGLFHQ